MPGKNGTVAALIESARTSERAGAWDEALEKYEAAFASLDRGADPAGAANLMRLIGRVHRERGDLELAVEAFEASLTIARANGLRDYTAQALNSLGIAQQALGHMEASESLYTEARALAQELGDVRLVAMIDQNLGSLANIRGDTAAALRAYRSSLDHYQRLGEHRFAVQTLMNMGMAHVDRSEWRAAQACFEGAAELAPLAGDPVVTGMVELNRAELHLKRQRYEHARESCELALEIFDRVKSKARLAEVYKFLGILYRETSKTHLSHIHFALSLGLAELCGDRLLEAETQSEWALAHVDDGRARDAIKCLNRAHRVFSELRARRDRLGVERKLAELRERYLPVVRSWSSEVIESKDKFLVGHTQRVADYGALLGRAMGLSDGDLATLQLGAFVYDVGRAAVPAAVQTKAGRLTPEERELMQSHTVVGEGIVAELGFPREIRPMVRNHHEHWNGGGYPDGLRGEEIPLSARILCVADVYSALTTDRSHRPALSRADALQVMESDAGRILDPTLFQTFRTIVEQGVAT